MRGCHADSWDTALGHLIIFTNIPKSQAVLIPGSWDKECYSYKKWKWMLKKNAGEDMEKLEPSTTSAINKK